MATATAPAPAAREPSLRVIRPSSGWASLDLGELWRYRDLVFFLTWRNVLVRYKQTFLGVAWALVQPTLLMIILTFVARRANFPSNGAPLPIFFFAGLLPWIFFANSLAQSSNSLVASSNLISKVYFPRLALPLSTVLSSLVEFLLASTVLVGLMAYYGIAPDPVAIVLVPALVALVIVTALGVGLWLSALNVAYRDVQYVVPFVTQLWFLATVVYPSSLLSEPWRTLFGLNPMAGVVEGFRWALLDTTESPGPMLPVSAAVSLLLLASGAFFFRRMERSFADVV